MVEDTNHDGRGTRVGAAMAYRMAALATFGAAALLYQLWLGGDWRPSVPWLPSLGIDLAFRLDGLSRLFALLVLGVGGVVFLYAAAYFRGAALFSRTILVMGLFMAAMLGLVLADDVVTLFVFWELTTVCSFLLVGYAHERAQARGAALMGLLVTGAGGLALLAGLLLLGQVAGTYRISALLVMGPTVRADPLYPVFLALILLGAFTKSAQFPFHFWLPAAMAAPTPVSAYLHSATMVKAGVYLLARLTPVLGETDA
jgi:multicomponent Na+:H+ antiporter subunit A